jgi:hypothetical protein
VRWLPALWAVPFVTYLLLGQDVTHVRYTLPLAALAVVLAGVGTAGPRRMPAAAVAVLAAFGVTWTEAPEHRHVEPTEFQLARFLARHHSRDAALLLPEMEAALTTIVHAHAPGVAPVWVSASEMTRRATALEAQGATVYATIPAPDDAGAWTPVARFSRSLHLDVHYAPELWLFRHDPPGPRPTGPPPAQ